MCPRMYLCPLRFCLLPSLVTPSHLVPICHSIAPGWTTATSYPRITTPSGPWRWDLEKPLLCNMFWSVLYLCTCTPSYPLYPLHPILIPILPIPFHKFILIPIHCYIVHHVASPAHQVPDSSAPPLPSAAAAALTPESHHQHPHHQEFQMNIIFEFCDAGQYKMAVQNGGLHSPQSHVGHAWGSPPHTHGRPFLLPSFAPQGVSVRHSHSNALVWHRIG